MIHSKMSLALSLDNLNDEGAKALLWPVNDSPQVFDCLDYETVRLFSFTLLHLFFVLIISRQTWSLKIDTCILCFLHMSTSSTSSTSHSLTTLTSNTSSSLRVRQSSTSLSLRIFPSYLSHYL